MPPQIDPRRRIARWKRWVGLGVVGAAAAYYLRIHPAGSSRSEEPASASRGGDERSVQLHTRPAEPAGRRFYVHGPTRAETAVRLTACFRRAQLTAELELEQQRYAANYWQPDRGGAQLQALENRRRVVLGRLNSELNAALDELCPEESGAPLELTPLFSLESPGPNLGYASAESRRQFEADLADLVADNAGRVGRDQLRQAAAATLGADEQMQYQHWNAPDAALLRNRLVGFDSTEAEFTAILQWTDSTAAEGPDSDAAQAAQARAVAQIGPERFQELQRSDTPAMQTALQDLHRWDLPLEAAGWLAQFRGSASEGVQQVWRDPNVPDAIKPVRVAELQRSYRATIAARLGAPDLASGPVDLLP